MAGKCSSRSRTTWLEPCALGECYFFKLLKLKDLVDLGRIELPTPWLQNSLG